MILKPRKSPLKHRHLPLRQELAWRRTCAVRVPRICASWDQYGHGSAYGSGVRTGWMRVRKMFRGQWWGPWRWERCP